MTNYERAVRFERPDAIPMTFAVNPSCWYTYPQNALFDLMAAHPYLFPDFQRPTGQYVPWQHPVTHKGAPFTDDFGCVWETRMEGLTGTVKKHPLADWSRYSSYRFPDPEVCTGIGPIDWAKEAEYIRAARAKGEFINRGLRHGHTFLQLSDIRGYENLMYDMSDEEPLLWDLIDHVERFNAAIIRHYLSLGVDQISYGEDLGMQYGPMLSVENFRKYIKPSYKRLMAPALEMGTIIHMHSDGDIRLLVDDLLDDGVQVLNLQDLVNGIEWIANRFRGKLCVELDIDRQFVTYGGTPQQIDDLIRKEVSSIGTRDGGLAMIYGLYPGIPMENIAALMDAMEKYAGYFD